MLSALNGTDISFLAGDGQTFRRHALPPYHPDVLKFLHDLSRVLLRHGEARNFPDVTTFAFWCRHANLQSLATEHMATHTRPRRGLGVVFHIAPSNVPVNFAYSYAFGLLAGNSNLVRVSSRDFEQTVLICRCLEELLLREEYRKIREMTLIAQYPHNDAINNCLSAISDGRVLWGGDKTIAHFRSMPAKCRVVDVAFADRHSMCLMEASATLRCSEEALHELAHNFYNDAYLMDQNACSSPHLVLWLGNEANVRQAQNKFWDALYTVAKKKYRLEPALAVEKLTGLYSHAMRFPFIAEYKKYSNLLYVATLSELPKSPDLFRGTAGCFFQCRLENLDMLSDWLTEKTQSLMYFGIDPQAFRELARTRDLSGLDRIVPVGKALDISPFWDGYDLIATLSRIVDIV